MSLQKLADKSEKRIAIIAGLRKEVATCDKEINKLQNEVARINKERMGGLEIRNDLREDIKAMQTQIENQKKFVLMMTDLVERITQQLSE